MEAKIGGEPHQFYGPGAPEMSGVGKKRTEWDLNDWKWDSDLFVATPLNAVPSDCRNKQLFPVQAFGRLSNSSSSCSDETDCGINEKGKGESEKRRREVVVVEEDEPDVEAGSLTLELGGHAYSIMEVDYATWEGKNGKRNKVQGANSNRATCQVEGCDADLSDARSYHRRHKVCEMHAKVSRALVGNVTQRFCQQCSRFHLLQEFDEGKRSCRRRLAGHNRRRRKTHPVAVVSGNSLVDDRASSYLLINLLRILSNLNSDSSVQLKDQDLLSDLLRNFANVAGSFDARNLPGLLQASQDLHKSGTSPGTSSEAAHVLISNGVTTQESSRPLCSTSKINCITEIQGSPLQPIDQSVSVAVAAVEMPQKRDITETSLGLTEERVRFKSFDLNNVYNDGLDSREGPENSVTRTPANLQPGSLSCPSWALQDSCLVSPPQTSGNSDSASAQSLSSSNGDAQSRTDRIIFKLFGKDPSDFPLVLRAQILDWLSNSPTDIEGYIRPGCIILTIYLRLAESTWEELCHNLSSSLKRLLDVAEDDFWRKGWVHASVQHQMAFIYNGQVVLDTPLLLNSHNHCKISSVTPIAVPVSGKVNFTVKGFSLGRSTTRLLCVFEGKYLVHEMTQALVRGTGTSNEHDESQSLNFSCTFPNAIGRGFIEVEDNGLSSGFFPFIVAEDDVSSEICMLECSINVAPSDENCQDRNAGMKARAQALDFLHEMGWLLQRNYLRSKSQHLNSPSNVFSLTRFKWLMEFSMHHNWCAVVKKLLDILFGGAVDVGSDSVELALSEMALLHSAVQKNCRPMVELLLRYVPNEASENTGSQYTPVELCSKNFLFRPDMLGPFDVTPLHVAASRDDAESMLDALTDDPGLVGIKAWKSARDSTGFTPEDYAHSRGYESYIHLVQKKNNQNSGAGHVVVNIPESLSDPDVMQKQADGPNSVNLTGFQVDTSRVKPTLQRSCRLCTRRSAHGIGSRKLRYRPAVVFMVGIAAVCVCVGLLLKSPPEVFSAFPPFRWDLLGYGAM